jgi:hypothetical protein
MRSLGIRRAGNRNKLFAAKRQSNAPLRQQADRDE